MDLRRPVIITLHDTVTGFSRSYQKIEEFNGPLLTSAAEFGWTDGNDSCDCNRSLYLWDFGRLGPDLDECSDGRIEIVSIVDVYNWGTVYSETQE